MENILISRTQAFMEWKINSHPELRWSDWMSPIEAAECSVWISEKIRSDIRWIK